MAKEKEVKKQKSGKAKRTIISIGIAILFVMFVAYAIESIYASPKYENYCNSTLIKPIDYINRTSCEANNGTWTQYEPMPVAKTGEIMATGYCDLYTRCSTEYQNVNEKYNRNVFFISLSVGIVILIL